MSYRPRGLTTKSHAHHPSAARTPNRNGPNIMSDFDFPQPLRIVGGSYDRGSGQGCAMNVISYINGDEVITDYPSCSAGPLARLVQICNDELAGGRGKPLQPQDALRVLDLGWRTMGTGAPPPEIYELYAWYLQKVVGDNFGFADEPASKHVPMDPLALPRYSAYRANQYCNRRFTRIETFLELTDRTITAWREQMGLPPRPALTTQALQPALTEMSHPATTQAAIDEMTTT